MEESDPAATAITLMGGTKIYLVVSKFDDRNIEGDFIGNSFIIEGAYLSEQKAKIAEKRLEGVQRYGKCYTVIEEVTLEV